MAADAIPDKPGGKDDKKKDGPSTKTILMYTGLLIVLIGFLILIAFMSGAFDDVGANSNSMQILDTMEGDGSYAPQEDIDLYGFYIVK